MTYEKQGTSFDFHAGAHELQGRDVAPRKGDWIQVYTGKRFWVLDPRSEDVDIRDIAHALSLQCRYGGHCEFFYSVAEHCVLLANWVWQYTNDRHLAFAALMHDAAEAYLPDLARPTKHFMPEYMAIEKGLEAVIFPRFRILSGALETIKQWDTRILMDERAQLFKNPLQWGSDSEPLGQVYLQGLSPADAERQFLNTFAMLAEAA